MEPAQKLGGLPCTIYKLIIFCDVMLRNHAKPESPQETRIFRHGIVDLSAPSRSAREILAKAIDALPKEIGYADTLRVLEMTKEEIREQASIEHLRAAEAASEGKPSISHAELKRRLAVARAEEQPRPHA